MGFIAKTIGIIILIFLSAEGSILSPNLGWVIAFLLIIDFSATSAIKKDIRQYGMSHNTPVTKSWIVIGTLAEITIIALSIYIFLT